MPDIDDFHQSVIGNLEFFGVESSYSGNLADTLEIFKIIIRLCQKVIEIGASPPTLLKFRNILNTCVDNMSLTEPKLVENENTVGTISDSLRCLENYLYRYYLNRRMWGKCHKELELCIYRMFTVYTTAIDKWMGPRDDSFRRMVQDTNMKIAHNILTFIALNDNGSRHEIVEYATMLREDMRLKQAEKEYERSINSTFYNYDIQNSVQKLTDLYKVSLNLYSCKERVNTVVSQQRRKAMCNIR